MRLSLGEAVKQRVLLADGAMGTQLIESGLAAGQSGDAWNLTEPQKVRAIQQAYVDAGCDILLTNSFQGCPLALARHDLSHQAYEINLAAARIARDCIGGLGYVLGDIGPFGGFLAPLGNTPRKELENAFAVQATALLDGGVDGIIVETMTALDELETAVTAVRRCRRHVPIVASITFDRVADGGYRTMTGVSVSDAVGFLVHLGVDLVGCNCGTGLHAGDYVELVSQFRRVTDLPLMVQPNAGQPRLDRGRIVYDETPEVMAECVPALVRAGASIIGGCCGTTPEHMRLFRGQLERMQADRR
jgi:5-methyltetrahydrofolate--homocysteine methyltransferase